MYNRLRCGSTGGEVVGLYGVVACAMLLVVGLVVLQCARLWAEEPKAGKSYTETIVDENGEKISFKMVLIPGGTFEMGSPAGEADRKEDEGPQHEVRVDPFYLCTTETTIKLFLAYYSETMSAKRPDATGEVFQEKAPLEPEDCDTITGPTPVYGNLAMGFGENNPAIGATWYNAVTFGKWLCKKTGKRYRLPTEAEWEYAFRAGSTKAYGQADDAEQLGDYAWYDDNSDSEPHEVGTKKSNAWGLYDMAGNVREWVYDFYSPTGYAEAAKKNPAVNPKGPETGKLHVARGGDYSSSAEELRCAARSLEQEWWRMGDPQIPKSKWWLPEIDIVGFRVARSLAPGEK